MRAREFPFWAVLVFGLVGGRVQFCCWAFTVKTVKAQWSFFLLPQPSACRVASHNSSKKKTESFSLSLSHSAAPTLQIPIVSIELRRRLQRPTRLLFSSTIVTPVDRHRDRHLQLRQTPSPTAASLAGVRTPSELLRWLYAILWVGFFSPRGALSAYVNCWCWGVVFLQIGFWRPPDFVDFRRFPVGFLG